MNTIVRCKVGSHESGRLSPEAFGSGVNRHFYAAAHKGLWAVFEQTGPATDYWCLCVGGLLYYTDALDMADRLNKLQLSARS